MPVIATKNRHSKQTADTADRFAIKNFILSHSSPIPADLSLGEAIIFDGFVLAICLKGQASFKLNHREYFVSKGMIFAALPGQIFRLTDKSDDLLVETLFISVDYILRLPLPKNLGLLKKMSNDPVREVCPESIHNMLELHAITAKYHRRVGSNFRELQTKALIYALLLEIGNAYSVPSPKIPKSISRHEALTDKFFELLLKNFKTERGVAFYADKLCLTPKHLSMTVKKITGHPISNWINEAVIIEAKRMLKATDMTALQISEELNFPNPSFFSRFFKDHTEMTPLQYKNS